MDKVRICHFEEVIRVLMHNRRIVGKVSYQAIEDKSRELERSGHRVCGVPVTRVPHSTAHNLFTKSLRRVPRWELLESLWATLYRLAEERGRDTGDMVALEDLRDHHQRMDAVTVEAVTQGQPVQYIGRLVGTSDVLGVVTDSGETARGDSEAGPSLPRLSVHAASASAQGRRCMQDVDDQFLDELRKRSRQAPWRAYRDVIPGWFERFVMVEPELSEIRTYAPLCIPSLLQTGEYARLFIARDLRGCSEEELQRRVELRLCRQEILHRPDAPKLWVLLHERVLRDDAGSRPVLRAQVRHLLSLAERSNITIQVIPADRASNAVVDGPLTIMRFPESHINDMVFLEQRAHGLYLFRASDLSYFTSVFATYMIAALSPRESTCFLHDLL